MIWAILLKGFTEPLLKAQAQRLAAQNDQERMLADQTIKEIEAARAIAVIEAQDRWSANRIGRLFIVVPFGLWWTAIFIDSIFDFPWVVLALPPAILDMAKVLIPAILIADVVRSRK